MLREINESSYKKTIRLLEKEKREITRLMSNQPLDLKYRLGDLNYCIAFVNLAFKESQRLKTQHKLF
jgi:hypothetical protein